MDVQSAPASSTEAEGASLSHSAVDLDERDGGARVPDAYQSDAMQT